MCCTPPKKKPLARNLNGVFQREAISHAGGCVETLADGKIHLRDSVLIAEPVRMQRAQVQPASTRQSLTTPLGHGLRSHLKELRSINRTADLGEQDGVGVQLGT